MCCNGEACVVDNIPTSLYAYAWPLQAILVVFAECMFVCGNALNKLLLQFTTADVLFACYNAELALWTVQELLQYCTILTTNMSLHVQHMAHSQDPK